MKTRWLSLFILALLQPTAAIAQDALRPLKADELIGAKALDRQGKELGTVADLIVAPRAGAVHYAVVSFDGWLWLRDKPYLFPVTALAAGASPGQLTVQVDKEDLGKRTGVDELETWRRPYQPDANVNSEYVRASELLGSELVSAGGEALGHISELVFDARNGALRLIVAGGAAFPASRLKPQAGGERYVLRAPFQVVDRLHRDFGEIRDSRERVE